MKIHVLGAGHMTKMVAMPINGKNISSLRTSGPISTTLGMKHQRLKPIIICANDNTWLILTYFIARSNFAN